MDTQKHPIDDLFREALKDLREEPSAAGREASLKEAERELRRSDQRKWWLIIPLLFLILAGIGTATWVILSSPGSENIATATPASPAVTVAEPVPPPTAESIKSNQQSAEIITVKEKQTNITSDKTSHQATITPIGQKTTTSEEKEQEPVITGSVQPAIVDAPTAAKSDTGKPAQAISPAVPVPDALPAPDSIPPPKPKKPSVQRKNASLNLGVNYVPEWMFNTLEGDKYVNNFGLEGSFRFERYSIRTGLGLSITTGTNELAIGYNEYLGAYQDLDSIKFTWDEQHYKLLPTYYTSEQDVWDSLVKIEDNKVIKRYTYLQIPLILGYDFIVKGRFSMGVRTGPVLSLLLNSKQLSANYDPGKDKIVTINEITPDRIQTNWQVMAGINFAYIFSRRWALELEPEARYYFNSVYEKSDITKKPWSLGIRAAILFDLKK